jgi:hypothetical protein
VLLPELWPDLETAERESVLGYMTHFGLCCPLPQEEDEEGATPLYLVPSLLPALPEGKSIWAENSEHDRELLIKFIHDQGVWEEAAGYLPDTLFFRLVALIVQTTTIGVAFKHLYADQIVINGPTRYRIKIDREQHHLRLTAYKPDNDDVLAKVEDQVTQHLKDLMKFFGVKFRLEVKCEHNGEESLWPLEDLADDNEARNVWGPAEPEPEPEQTCGRERCCYGLVFLWVAATGVAVILLVYSVVLGSAGEDLAPRREVIITNGTAPPCADDEYLLDHLCHTCEDCVDGQMCSRHGATSGCHDCPAGMHDDDADVMSKCVDCPDGLTSSPQAIGCVEPDDFAHNLEDHLNNIVEIIGGLVGLGVTCVCKGKQYSLSCAGEEKESNSPEKERYSPLDRDDEG